MYINKIKTKGLLAAIPLLCFTSLFSNMAIAITSTDNTVTFEQLSPSQRYQLLYYSTFGPKPDSYVELKKSGYPHWLEKQFSTPATSHEALLLTHKQSESHKTRENVWWTIAIESDDQLRQRVAFALSEILVISRFGSGLNKYPRSLANYYDLLVNNAFGNYRQVLQEVTLHPAMGRYLSMMGSRKANAAKGTFPDENYAREVMQLFTIGLYQLNIDGSRKLDSAGNELPSYSQTDVEEVARAFSGWLRERDDDDLLKPMRAVKKRHDFGEKVVLGNKISANQSPQQDVTQVLDILFNHPNSPPFISTLLIKRLTTSNPSPAYIERVSKVFIDNGKGVRGDLKAVVRAILLDKEAMGLSEDKPIKIKEPVIAFANIQRALYSPSFSSAANVREVYKGLNQGPLMSPSVFNFFSPDYQPSTQFREMNLVSPELEIISWSAYINYSNLVRKMLFGSKKQKAKVNIDEFLQLKGQPSELIDLIDKRFFSDSMSHKLQTILLEHLSKTKARTDNTVRQVLHLALISDEFLVQE